MEKIEVFFLGIEGFEAFSLASLGTTERVRSSHFHSAREESAP